MDFVTQGVARDRSHKACPVLGGRFDRMPPRPPQDSWFEARVSVRDMLWLVLHCADLDEEDEVGWTAVTFALTDGDLPCLQLLVEAGANSTVDLPCLQLRVEAGANSAVDLPSSSVRRCLRYLAVTSAYPAFVTRRPPIRTSRWSRR